LHRPLHQLPEFTLTFATFNVQSLRFDLIAHRGKLQELISLLRHHDIHICCLQEVRTQGSQLYVWYIEEYLFVVYGKVAIALVNSVARKWESTGRQFLVRPNASNENILSLILLFEHWTLAATCNYTPNTNKVGDKRAHYFQCTHQYRSLCEAGYFQIWAVIGMDTSVRGTDRPRHVVRMD